MPYSKSTQKDYGENPLQKKSSFTMKSGNSPLFKQMGSSPAKHTVAGDRAKLHEDAYGKGHDNSKHPKYWKKETKGKLKGHSRKSAEKELGKYLKSIEENPEQLLE